MGGHELNLSFQRPGEGSALTRTRDTYGDRTSQATARQAPLRQPSSFEVRSLSTVEHSLEPRVGTFGLGSLVSRAYS